MIREDLTKAMTIRRYIQWLPPVYAILIVTAMVIPINRRGSEVSFSDEIAVGLRWDYLMHFGIFFLFMASIRLCRRVSFRKNVRETVVWIVTAVILAVVTEYIQYYLPWRGYNVNDIIANVLGVVLGLAFFIDRRRGYVKVRDE